MIRTRTLPLRLIPESGLDWKALSAALRPHFIAATELGNFVTRYLLQHDAECATGDDGRRRLPKFASALSSVLYRECRRRWPSLNSRCLSQMLQVHIRNWLRSRFDLLALRTSKPRWFTTYPQPVVVSDSFTLAAHDDGFLLAFSVDAGAKGALSYGTHTRHQFCMRLKTDRSDRPLLTRMIDGTYDCVQCSLDRDKHGRLIARLAYRFEPPAIADRADADRLCIVGCGFPPNLLTCCIEGRGEPWIIPGSDVRSVMASVLDRRTAIARDMKREMRLPARRRRRRQAAIERACRYRDDFLRTWCQRAAQAIVRYAVNNGCGRISVAEWSAFDFPWFRLKSALLNAAAPFSAHLTLVCASDKKKEKHDESDSSPAAAAAP